MRSTIRQIYSYLLLRFHLICCMETPSEKKQKKAFNALWPSDGIWRHRSGSTLAQVMACCPTAPSHYLRDNQIRSGESWWRHQMGTFSALLALCAGNSPVTGELPAQRPVTPSFDLFFDVRLNKRLSIQSWGGWFETPSRSLWHHCNAYPNECRSLVCIGQICYHPNLHRTRPCIKQSLDT